MRGESGFFDVDERLKRLSDLGDQLLAFAAAVDFEMFRAELTRALAYSDGSQGGRPPFDPVLMFKVLVVQATNNLSDERAEFLINDRLSFMRFLGWAWRIGFPTRARSGCSGKSSPTPERSSHCSTGSTRLYAKPATSPWAGRSSTPRSSPRPSSAIRRRRRRRSRKAGFRRTGKPSRPSSGRRIATRAGRSSSARPRRGRRHKAGRRHRDPDVRLSEPRLDRPPIRADPPLGRDRRGGLRGRAATRGTARQDQHREPGVGGHGLSIEGQRGVPRQERLRQSHSQKEASSAADARDDAARQCAQVRGPLTRRARLRDAERQNGALHPDHRHSQREMKIGMANIVYNVKRLVFLGRLAAA